MNKIDEVTKLIELDTYFKHYELYKRHIENISTQYDSLLEIKKKIEEVSQLSNGNDKSLYDKFNKALKLIEYDNLSISSRFNNYDFNEDRVKEIFIDYKILCYGFVKNNLVKYIYNYIELNGLFETEQAFDYFVDRMEMVIWEFFTRNFMYNDEISSVFGTAKADILEKEKQKFLA